MGVSLSSVLLLGVELEVSEALEVEGVGRCSSFLRCSLFISSNIPLAIASGVSLATQDTNGVFVIVLEEDVLGLGGELRLRGGEFDGEIHMGMHR